MFITMPYADYSLTEKAVGTWIDGRTIYTRSYVMQTNKSITSSNKNSLRFSEIDNVNDITWIIDSIFTRLIAGHVRWACFLDSSGILFKTDEYDITFLAGSVITLWYLKD